MDGALTKVVDLGSKAVFTVGKDILIRVFNMYHVIGLNTKLSRILKFNTEVISFCSHEKERKCHMFLFCWLLVVFSLL